MAICFENENKDSLSYGSKHMNAYRRTITNEFVFLIIASIKVVNYTNVKCYKWRTRIYIVEWYDSNNVERHRKNRIVLWILNTIICSLDSTLWNPKSKINQNLIGKRTESMWFKGISQLLSNHISSSFQIVVRFS